VVVGRLGRPHGLKGFLVLFSDTDNLDRFRPGATLLTEHGVALTVRSMRPQGEGQIIAFSGVSDRSAAEGIQGQVLWIEVVERRPLGTDEWWPDQLEGLEVRDEGGSRLGTVVRVVTGPGQDRLVVEIDNGSWEVPLVRELVPEVSIEGGYLVVAPIPGLLNHSREE
jgi:16S rRNA processing protein RimM